MALSLIISEIFKYCNLEITVRGQSGSLKVVPFDTLDMVSYYCSIVTLSLRRTVFEIFDFKNAVTLKTGLGGPSRSLGMSPFDRAHMTSY